MRYGDGQKMADVSVKLYAAMFRVGECYWHILSAQDGTLRAEVKKVVADFMLRYCGRVTNRQ